MKRTSLPTSKKRRALLYNKKISRTELIEYGDLFFQHQRYVEAAEFYKKASHEQGMDSIVTVARETGDSFLLEIASKGLSRSNGIDPTVWEEVGRKAMELKKYSHALRAFQKAGNESLLQEVQRLCRGAAHSAKT